MAGIELAVDRLLLRREFVEAGAGSEKTGLDGDARTLEATSQGM